MIKKLLITGILFLNAFRVLFAYENSFSVTNFHRNDYHAASQNWHIAPGDEDIIYFANHNGLLEFDGTTWKLNPLTQKAITRSVFVENDSLIYSSGYREMGFWERDKTGNLSYHSLNPLAEKFFAQNEEFWNIVSLNNAIYFHSFNRVIRYSDGSAIPIELPGFSNTMHKVRDNILIAIQDQGIWKIEDTLVVPYLKDQFFRNKTVRFILPYKEDQLMIGTSSDGIVLWDGTRIRQWKPELKEYFVQNELNRAHLSDNGNLILGTILDGIVIFDSDEVLRYRFSITNGLQNNTVLGISTDRFNNIWLALDSGIDCISPATARSIATENISHIGAVYSAAIFESNLYLTTNQGLYRSSPNGHKYELLDGTQGQNWDCKIIDNLMFVGHNSGTIMVDNGKAVFISKVSGGFAIREDTKSDLLIQSTYSRMAAFRKSDGKYVFSHFIDGFQDLIRYIEFDHTGNIWASHMHRGIFKLSLDEQRKNVTNWQYFGENSAFKKDHSLHVFKIEDRIVFTSKEKIFTYDDLNDTIVPYDALNSQTGIYAKAHRIIPAPGHNYWFITSEGFALFKIRGNAVQLIREYTTSILTGNRLIEDFENIYPVSDKEAILCLENGIAEINVAIPDSVSTIRKLIPKMRKINTIDRHNNFTEEIIENNKLKINYWNNSMEARYSLPHISNEPVYFQAWFEGIHEEWSEKSEKPYFRFYRLPSGIYKLHVKASDSWGNESAVSTLTVEILPPLYKSTLARICYVLIFAFMLLLFRKLIIKQTRKKEKAEREKKEQELTRLRNEKLNAEIMHKSRELANSTMSIIKKNEFLLELKSITFNQKEQLGSRYPDKYFMHIVDKIDKNMSSKDDWNLFETNFEQAHEQFSKKLKKDFPELTAKDLRLCAYLRMNLSSKEIAPLMAISVRGVENHRYRLRKKMGMEHDNSLIGLILKY